MSEHLAIIVLVLILCSQLKPEVGLPNVTFLFSILLIISLIYDLVEKMV